MSMKPKPPVEDYEELEDAFLHDRMPMLPKYDGTVRPKYFHAIPMEDAPDYESPDEETRSRHFHS
jgi:hypothetical protein